MIIVDDRKEQDTYYGLLNRGITDAEVKRIPYADVLMDNGVAVERKGHDLLGSLTGGRIFEQLSGLNEYEHPILCIVNENIWRDMYFSKSNWIHKSYQGFLTTTALSYPKLKIFFFTCMEDYLDFLVALNKKIHKEGVSTRPIIIPRKPKSIQERKENMLCMIEGLGVPKAKLLLNEFGNIYDLCSANMIELQAVKGIGKKLAEGIYKTLH